MIIDPRVILDIELSNHESILDEYLNDLSLKSSKDKSTSNEDCCKKTKEIQKYLKESEKDVEMQNQF